MNRAQQRRIAITFQHVDDLLNGAVQALAGTGADSPFCQIFSDADPVQRRVIEVFAGQVRALMLETLFRCGIAPIPPFISATRAAQAQILGAEIDLQELTPKSLKGYGDIALEEVQALTEANAAILAVLAQMGAFLRSASGTGGL